MNGTEPNSDSVPEAQRMAEWAAEYYRLLGEALSYVEAVTTYWNEWAGELDNRRRQEQARKLADQIRAVLDGHSYP